MAPYDPPRSAPTTGQGAAPGPGRPILKAPHRPLQKDGPKGHEMLLRMMITGKADTHIVLMSGDLIRGTIYESDKYTVSLRTIEKPDGDFESPHPVIIFKHAIERMWFHLPNRISQ